jgi:hypothetical protein
MTTLKEDLFGTCNEIAAKFPGWAFINGQFKNKSLKHTDFIVHLGFGFDHKNSTALSPSVWLENKKCKNLCVKLLQLKSNSHAIVSMINFQAIHDELAYIPEKFRSLCWIEQNKLTKEAYLSAMRNFFAKSPPGTAEKIWDHTLDFTEARPVLEAVLRDGITLIERHYDLSSEANFLRALPPKYTPSRGIPYDEMERQKGLMMCIVHILLGDFDFVERYRSEAFVTIYPKRTTELDKIIAGLPELKKRYAETGSVV